MSIPFGERGGTARGLLDLATGCYPAFLFGGGLGDLLPVFHFHDVTRGWQQVLDQYKKRYNSREKMGTLTFSDLEITVLSKDAALVLGRWRLKRANDEPHGTFSLLFRKTKAGWRIVHDHSSAA